MLKNGQKEIKTLKNRMWIIVDNFVDNSVTIGYRIKISDFR